MYAKHHIYKVHMIMLYIMCDSICVYIYIIHDIFGYMVDNRELLIMIL